MVYLLDTTAVSDLMEDDANTEARMVALPPTGNALISPITRGEILHGIRRLAPGRRREELEAKAQRLFGRARCVSVPPAAGEHYANVKLARQRKGLSMDDNDLWIAATAIAFGAVLVTRDSDFDSIDGLQVENLSEWPAAGSVPE